MSCSDDGFCDRMTTVPLECTRDCRSTKERWYHHGVASWRKDLGRGGVGCPFGQEGGSLWVYMSEEAGSGV